MMMAVPIISVPQHSSQVPASISTPTGAMISSITESIPRKMVAIVLAATFAALVVAASALLLYDLRAYRDARISDLTAQAEIIGNASAAALTFNDPQTARQNVELLNTQTRVSAAAIFTKQGSEFASFARDKALVAWPAHASAQGYDIEGGHIFVISPIVQNNELLGTVYLRAPYEWLERVTDYVSILGMVMLLSLFVAVLFSARLQQAITKPLLEMSNSARQVITHRDYSQKVEKTTHDEIGYVVDAFNAMLEEVGRRTAAQEAADRRKDEFLATLAHELRNPLAPLRNALELQRLHGDNPAVMKKTREIMERQLAQMVHLVNDLLDISRITTGRIELQRERVELRAIVENSLEAVSTLQRAKNQEIAVALPAEQIHLHADPIRLSQILVNLLNNAIKYTPEGGRIEVSARAEDEDAYVAISDNGIGIEPDMLPAIFDMFTQVDRSLEQSHGGLGIGLALTRSLVELHGGTISARSEGAGRGSEFTIRLPIVRSLPFELAVSPAHNETAPLYRRRVLIVDDNRDYADSMMMVVQALGCEVRLAYDGENGLAIAREMQPEVAFLDIGLPSINGYELARRLRASPSTRHCLLVAVSGWGQPEDKERAMSAGFDQHHLKPIDPVQVKAILSRAEAVSA